MTHLQEFRIYPSQESYLADSPDWTPLSGEYSLEKCTLIAVDGKEYRLNFAKFAINNPWDDMDLNSPISRVIWFIPLDDYKWYVGHLNGTQLYAFKENNLWYAHAYDNVVQPVNDFKVYDTKRTYKRCLKVIQSNGTIQVLSRFVWETPKFVMHQLGPNKLRFAKMTEPQDQKPVAFVDDANGEEVIGYIYESKIHTDGLIGVK